MPDLASILSGFGTALAPGPLLACLLGVVMGTAVGVLPGVGPVTTIALLLPLTFGLSPTAAMIMLAGIYYGAQYGGSTTAILVNLPGEASSAVTSLDGHAMARQGRARAALSIAAISSFAAGTVGALIVALAAVPLSRLASLVEAADYASLMVLGLVVAVVTVPGSVLKASVMVVAGVLLGAVGTDVTTGDVRWTFGLAALYDGVGLLPVAIGLFGLAEIIEALTAGTARVAPVATDTRFGLDAGEVRRAAWATARGTCTGATLGLLPGGGPVLASFAAYAVERAVGGAGARGLGRGAVEGVASPEAANNAAAQTSFVPLLTLGLPSNPVMALLLGALVVHGVQPGPGIVEDEPALFWALVASMWIGNAMLLALNLPFAGLWARLLRVPYDYLYPATIVLSCAGMYAVSRSAADVWIAGAFAAAGWALKRRGFEPAPLLLGFVLSRPLEENLLRALVFSNGAISTFVVHPLSALLLALAVVAIAVTVAGRRRGLT